MPLPVSTTILLAAASIAIISRRFLPVAGVVARSVFYFTALVIAAYALATESGQNLTPASAIDRNSVWCQDALAHSEQWLVFGFGLLAGVGTFDSIRFERKSGNTY